MESKYLTTAEAADYLGLSEVRIRQLANAERIGQKIGRDWLFTQEELDAFANQERGPGRPPVDHD